MTGAIGQTRKEGKPGDCWEGALESDSSLKGVCRSLNKTQITK